MTDGPKLSVRARALRWALVALFVALSLVAFPTWSTVAVMALVGLAWVGGTIFGFMADEYFPAKRHTPKDWTSARQVGRRRIY